MMSGEWLESLVGNASGQLGQCVRLAQIYPKADLRVRNGDKERVKRRGMSWLASET